MIKKEKTIYKTPCQFIASTLFVCGVNFITTKKESGKCFFIFESKELCEEIVKKYYSKDGLVVSPRLLFDNFRTVKSLIYS